MVERGECPLGVVYSPEAAISAKVKVLGLFPEDSHPAISYPVALTKAIPGTFGIPIIYVSHYSDEIEVLSARMVRIKNGRTTNDPPK
jgi:hypothetical protein